MDELICANCSWTGPVGNLVQHFRADGSGFYLCEECDEQADPGNDDPDWEWI